MPISAGTKFGRYEIRSRLGAGGMGEVYLACDTQLERTVALKILPADVATNEDRMRRFTQEAKAAAGLNHPSIAHIYEIGEAKGTHFIAMEYVDGETLSDKIHRSKFPLKKLLEYLAQAADGLAKAHAAGIVHRDLKPDNIMITRDGHAKILDFGLAKLLEQQQRQHTDTEGLSEAATAMLLSTPGIVMGTIGYMSPEQAQGKPVDQRSDIFSFGCILHEAATERRPFEGESAIDTLHKLIYAPAPPIGDFNSLAPAELQRIVRKCLAKDPDERYQAIKEVAIDLRELRREMETGADLEHSGAPTSDGRVVSSGAARSASTLTKQRAASTTDAMAASRPASSVEYIVTEIKGHKRGVGIVLAALIVVAGGLAFWLYRSKEARSLPKNATFTQLTNQAGEELFPSLSPDGNSVVYASRASGNWDIYLQRVGGKNSINLTKDSEADDVQPVFSPDSEHIAFRSERDGGGIFIMGATGESPKRLTDFGYYPAWAPDGKEIVCSLDDFVDPNNRTVIPGQLWAVKVATAEKRLVTKEDAAQPSWSPHGGRIAYWGVHRGGQRDIWTIPASGGEPVSVTDDAPVDWNPVWSPDGNYLYFASDRGGSMNLWRVPIDESSGKVLGAPEPVTTPSAYSGYISFSSNGRRLAYVQTVTHNNLQQVSFDPQRERVVGTPSWITQGSRIATNPDLSSDGEWFVFDAVGDKQEDLFVVKRDGTGLRQLTNDTYKDRAPFWSPDGKKIVFFSDRSGRYESWTINPDGSDLQQVTYTDGRGTQLTIWSPDGSRVLCNFQFGAPIILEASKPWQEQTPETLSLGNDSDQWFMAYSWSPDGQKLAGILRRPESVSSNIVSYSLASEQFEQLANFGERPNWLSDSRRLLFSHQDKVYLLDSQTKKFHEVISVAPNRLQALGISKDNRLIYYSLTTNEADLWLMTLG